MTFFIVKKTPKHQGKPLKLILGKNVSKKAVERNLLKRRIRAAMQPIIGKSGNGFVVIVRPGAKNLSYKELREELGRETKTKQ